MDGLSLDLSRLRQNGKAIHRLPSSRHSLSFFDTPYSNKKQQLGSSEFEKAMTPETRGRSRSRSDASILSKSSGGRSKSRRGKRDRAESGGDVSVFSTASTTEAKAVEVEKLQVDEKGT